MDRLRRLGQDKTYLNPKLDGTALKRTIISSAFSIDGTAITHFTFKDVFLYVVSLERNS